jgi:RNA polymerase sigma-70 factor (ECF subfamily)
MIRDELLAYLKRRLPALRTDHDDLVSDALFGLTETIRRQSSAFPLDWFQDIAPVNEPERTHLHKLAMVILKRRIADLFRKRASLPSLSTIDVLTHEVADPNTPKPERSILLTAMLEITLSVLDKMHPEDRDLVAIVSNRTGVRKKLNARERQRLHRVRQRLNGEIARRLGADAKELLRSSD